ncbi:MAG: Hpt domain-containing protein [Desulfovibrio sp.]|jgi:HPt (histidine-containing phosphotransfer) domain-containing protein|nr:Hpt domain-containing protein [Desulfovibrio sp.]
MSASRIVLNTEAALERMGDMEIYAEIAHCFAANMEKYLEDLCRALERADMPAATRLAHSLKGNCGTVGAEELRLDCLRLEQICRAEDKAAAAALFGELRPRLLELRGILAAFQTSKA